MAEDFTVEEASGLGDAVGCYGASARGSARYRGLSVLNCAGPVFRARLIFRTHFALCHQKRLPRLVS